METLESFHQSRSVIEDFSSRTLSAIPSDFGRLSYICSLKDSSSGRYEHDGLSRLYPVSAVQAALKHCHEELFSRILETPLKEQARDLRDCLEAVGDAGWEVVERWGTDRSFQEMCPRDLPEYLQDLFCSNLTALLAILSARRHN